MIRRPATLDPEQHASAVDIADLEARDLGDAQAGAISDRQRRLVLEAGRRVQQAADLVVLSTTGLARMRHPDQSAREVGPVERVRKKNRSAETMLFIVGTGTPASR